MTRGRKPTPAHLRVVSNNPQKRPLPKGKRAVPDTLVMPTGLTAEQQRYWRYAISKAPAGLLKGIDREDLRNWCIAAARRDAAEDALNNSAMLIKTPNGMAVQNPYISIVNRQIEIMRKLSADLGFNPTSRTRLDFQDGAAGEDDGADAFF